VPEERLACGAVSSSRAARAGDRAARTLRLVAAVLPQDCRYFGVDTFTTMVAFARERLRPWAILIEEVVTLAEHCGKQNSAPKSSAESSARRGT
jgi:hypothetical protein